MNSKIIAPNQGGVVMSSDFRLFLDIKRELEYRITELKNNAETYQSEKIISDLEYQNRKLMELISEKQKDIEERDEEISKLNQKIQIVLNENNLLSSEFEKYKSNEEQLPLQSEARQNDNQKTSILKSILSFINNKDF